ncbi:MAG: hypothetical protein ACRDUY_09085 [Nitriliruptorales bacterium]
MKDEDLVDVLALMKSAVEADIKTLKKSNADIGKLASELVAHSAKNPTDGLLVGEEEVSRFLDTILTSG